MRTAIEIRVRLAALNQQRLAAQLPLIASSTANTGSAIAGLIQRAERRMEYTVIGDAVNLSARIQALARRARRWHPDQRGHSYGAGGCAQSWDSQPRDTPCQRQAARRTHLRGLLLGEQAMLRSRTRSDTTIWITIVGVGLACALVIIELAFQPHALALGPQQSRIVADYSADPRDAHMPGDCPNRRSRD